MVDQTPKSKQSPSPCWKTKLVDWLGAQGAGNLSIYMISILIAAVLLVSWLH